MVLLMIPRGCLVDFFKYESIYDFYSVLLKFKQHSMSHVFKISQLLAFIGCCWDLGGLIIFFLKNS